LEAIIYFAMGWLLLPHFTNREDRQMLELISQIEMIKLILLVVVMAAVEVIG